MSLDFPASGDALWSLYDATGIRPEYILPVLHLESGFNPAAVNPSSHATGIDQLMPPYQPPGYGGWSASAQLAGSVVPRYTNMVRQLGPIRSATKAYIANLLPAAVPTSKTLASIIARKGNDTLIAGQLTEAAVYAGNAGLDANRDGVIDVADIATLMRSQVNSAAVQQAITDTYALRPDETPAVDPVLGEDFEGQTPPGSNNPLMWVLTFALVAGVFAFRRGA